MKARHPRELVWNRYQPQTVSRERSCDFCPTARTHWPEFGWRWRWRRIGQGTESICPMCYADEIARVERNVGDHVPETCGKCGSRALHLSRCRIACLMCGWDYWVRPLLQRRVHMPTVVAFVLLLVAVLPAWGQGTGYYVSIADVSVTSTAAVQICPAAGNRVGCNCYQNGGSGGTVKVRFGDSAITTTRGDVWGAQTNATFTAPAGTWAIAESSSVTVSCTDERN